MSYPVSVGHATIGVMNETQYDNMTKTNLDLTKVMYRWSCAEHEGEDAYMSILDVSDVGTPICPDCGEDMELDTDAGVLLAK